MPTLPYLPILLPLPIIFTILLLTPLHCKKVINIYWNSSNTLFQSEEPILVNYNMDMFSFSQMSLICASSETYSIYLVPRQVYRQCHLQGGNDR